MQVFDFEIPDKDLEEALKESYKTDLAILRYEFEYHCKESPKRLALVLLTVQTQSGPETVTLLIKESSRRELVVISLMNKLLPYSSPKVVYYKLFSPGAWLFLENISTWVDIDGKHRVNEVLVDGLYVIHAEFFGNADRLLSNFKEFPVVDKDVLTRAASRALKAIQPLSEHELFTELFEKFHWGEIRQEVDETLSSISDLDFPNSLVHNSYYLNTTRAIRDPKGWLHVVAYDWQNAAVGWPQVDLSLLLDRLDVVARYQNLPGPSPILLARYASKLSDEFDIDTELFYKVYNVCYLCRVLPVMKWWMHGHLCYPSRDPERVHLEVRSKLERLSVLGEELDEHQDDGG